MSRSLPALLGALLLAGGVVFVWQLWAGKGPASPGEGLPGLRRAEEQHMDPKVRELLKESARGDEGHKSAFFATLSALAETKGWDAPGQFTEEGRAVAAQDGRTGYVVVILGGWEHFIPGTDWQHLLLLDWDGRLLDRLSCGINCRLTRMFVNHKGVFLTDALGVPEKDGAQFIIRYVPEKGGAIAGNWEHDITHGGETYRFHWGQDRPDALRSAELARQGLCRVAVREGKFAVLYPPLGNAAAAR